MLFNSYSFIFAFLPITLVIYILIRRLGRPTLLNVWLIVASLAFYSCWNPKYIFLLVFSIIFNYGIGIIINKFSDQPNWHRNCLIIGVTANVLLLGYFKYVGFFADILNDLSGINLNLGKIVLPLAISFFTLQQISYLIDAYRGEAKKFDFLSYMASVTFFPHLIAGPIVRYRDLLPQFSKGPATKAYDLTDLAVGITIFIMGLFKKVILADTIAVHANLAFAAAAANAQVTLLESWGAVMAFSFQVYFDFSGYSDMAIGLGRIFGIRLPINFNSPYKAVNFIDFWRRWHITLTDFIRDYIYFPMGGSRKGLSRQYFNIMVIMVVCGVWHGAGWGYFIWGAMHGAYIVINLLWHRLRRYLGQDLRQYTWYGTVAALATTFAAFQVSMAVFRADNLQATWVLIKGMAGFNGILLPEGHLQLYGLEFLKPVLNSWHIQVGKITLLGPYVMEWLILGWLIVWFMPNTQEIMSRVEPALGYRLKATEGTWTWLRWRPTPTWALVCGVLAVASLIMIARPSPFLYFQF